ncbi:MAG: hypothetical protein QOC60_1195 [Frankiaceae bacterium]|nr:hypothetical protein [Frankiaceae bacterium]
MTRYLDCPACAGEQPFEQPGCLDHHGVDCPEWFCSACGAAVVLGYSSITRRRITTVAA